VKGKSVDRGEAFFVTGVEKYLDAVSAVKMIEQDVQRRVKEVVKNHPLLAELFGEDWVLKNYREPGTDSMCLGQKVVFKDSEELCFYFYFGREPGDPHLVPVAMFWRARVTSLSELWNSAGAIRAPKLEVDNSHIYWTGSAPSSNDWASCEKALSAVIRDWIKLWQKLGGLPKYLKHKAR
jgi:hypothetical protein